MQIISILIYPILTCVFYSFFIGWNIKVGIVTLFFMLLGLINYRIISWAKETKDSTGFIKWLYTSIALKMISVVGLAYILTFHYAGGPKLAFLIIINYFTYSIIYIIGLNKT